LNAQGEAILSLARRRKLLDETRFRRARALEGDAERAIEALARLGLEPEAIDAIVEELAAARFRCRRCEEELSYGALARLPSFTCPRCRSALDDSLEEPVARKRIGPYELVEPLGKGAAGVVFRARKKGLDRDFAVKVLTVFEDKVALERFKREAQVAARLQHPGLVSVVDVGEEKGIHYYVMELVEGATLQEHLSKKAPLPPADAASLVARLAEAASFAHERGIVHRDLKPANVILEAATGAPKIADFGLARDVRDKRVTRTGDVLGTPYYMAPEQFSGDTAIDGRADVYALGVILYEALTRRRPFEAKTAAMLATFVLTAELVPPSEHVKGVPGELDAIVMKAMSREPDDRYATAADFAKDLERFARGEAIEAPSENAVTRAMRRTRRHVRARALVLPALLLGAALGAFGWEWLGREKAPTKVAGFDDVERALDAREPLARVREVVRGREIPPALEARFAELLLRSGRYEEALATASHIRGEPALVASATFVAALAEAKLGRVGPAATLLAPLAAKDTLARALAKTLEGAGDALDAARAALAERPESSLALRVVALAALAHGDANLALETARAAVEADPTEPDAWLLRARAARASGAPLDEAALDRAFELTAPEPPDSRAFIERAWVALLRSDPRKARSALDTMPVLRDDPEAATLGFLARFLQDEVDPSEKPPPLSDRVLDELGRGLRGVARYEIRREGQERIEALSGRVDPVARAAVRNALLAAAEGGPDPDMWFKLARLLAPQDGALAALQARWLLGLDRLERAREAIEHARANPGARVVELDYLEAERHFRKGHVGQAFALWSKLGREKGPLADYARIAPLLLNGDIRKVRELLATATRAAPTSPELERLSAYTLVTKLISLQLNPDLKAAVSNSARRALELEGALDQETVFFGDYAELTRDIDPATVDKPEWRERYLGLDKKYAELAPETGRYSYYLARVALRSEAATAIALDRLKVASARDGEPWLELGEAFLHIRYSLAAQSKKDQARLAEEMEAAKASLLKAREKDKELWIPWDLLQRFTDLKEPIPPELENPKMP